MTIVKAVDNYRWGWNQTFPFVGTQNPSAEDGTFEVENDEDAKNLVDLNIGFEIASSVGESGSNGSAKEKDNGSKPQEAPEETEELEEIKEKSEEDELSQQVASSEEVVASSTEDNEAYKAELAQKTRKELEELCKVFPSVEWRGKNKEELVDFLVSKLS